MQSASETSASSTTSSGPVMQRSSVTLAEGFSTIRLGAPGEAALPSGLSARPGTSVQSRSTSSRGSSSAGRPAGRCSAPPENTMPSRTSRPRAPIASVMSPPAAISGRAGLPRRDDHRQAGHAVAGDAVDREGRRSPHRSGCRAMTQPPAARDRVELGLQRIAVRDGPLHGQIRAVRRALVLAAADGAGRAVVEGGEQAVRRPARPAGRGRARDRGRSCRRARRPRGSSR